MNQWKIARETTLKWLCACWLKDVRNAAARKTTEEMDVVRED